MNIHRYQASSPAEAFEMASKDSKNWDFAAMDALTQMAEAIRNGFTPTMTIGSGKTYACAAGSFLMFDDEPHRGYGISLVGLTGHEVGIDDPAAQEVLDHHREHRGQELYAYRLLTWSQHIDSIDDLDEAYKNLLEGDLIEKTGRTVGVTVDDAQYERPAYVVR
jgi:hypothetical protein